MCVVIAPLFSFGFKQHYHDERDTIVRLCSGAQMKLLFVILAWMELKIKISGVWKGF
jgi:hypothetical protein